jgi:hypothetical protein
MGYLESLARGQEERLESLTRWLMGGYYYAQRYNDSA